MLDLTDNDVYDALSTFFALIVPQGTPILRGQQNRVAMPNVPFVLMTTLGEPRRIGTNKESTEATVVNGEITGFNYLVESDFEYSVQADFYSPDAEKWATGVELLWRSKFGWSFMPDGIKPLYSEGRMQLPLVGGESQWVQRWTMTLFLDYQPTWTQTTQAATVATVIPKAIDVFFQAGFPADSGVTADSDITI